MDLINYSLCFIRYAFIHLIFLFKQIKMPQIKPNKINAVFTALIAFADICINLKGNKKSCFCRMGKRQLNVATGPQPQNPASTCMPQKII